MENLLNSVRLKKALKALFPFAGLILVFCFFMIGTGGKLLSSTNLENLIDQGFTTIVITVGASFIYACGMMDVSLGAVMAFSEMIIGRLMLAGGWPLPAIILAGIAVAMALTSITAIAAHYLKVQCMIASMCVMNIGSGIVKTNIAQNELYIPYRDYAFLNRIPLKAAVVILIIALGLIIFNHTRLGREVRAIGGNRVAAAQSGVKVGRATVLAFLCCGFCVGVAGLFSLCYVGVLNSQTGGGVGLNVIVALVLGGFPLSGGPRARILSSVMGALTVTVLTNGLGLMGLDTAVSSVVKGLLFLIIIGISYERAKGAEVI